MGAGKRSSSSCAAAEHAKYAATPTNKTKKLRELAEEPARIRPISTTQTIPLRTYHPWSGSTDGIRRACHPQSETSHRPHDLSSRKPLRSHRSAAFQRDSQAHCCDNTPPLNYGKAAFPHRRLPGAACFPACLDASRGTPIASRAIADLGSAVTALSARYSEARPASASPSQAKTSQSHCSNSNHQHQLAWYESKHSLDAVSRPSESGAVGRHLRYPDHSKYFCVKMASRSDSATKNKLVEMRVFSCARNDDMRLPGKCRTKVSAVESLALSCVIHLSTSSAR